MTLDHPRWYSAAIGGTGAYAAGSIPLLLLMATDESLTSLTYASWIMTIVGLVMIFALFARLHYLKGADMRAEAAGKPSAEKKAIRRAATLKADRARMRRQLGVFAWINIVVFCGWGLIWVFPIKSQCLIQNLMLSRSLSICFE